MQASTFSRRTFLVRAAASGSIALSRTAGGASIKVLTPEEFGACGDGRTNDTQAFAALSSRIDDAGGGTVRLARGRTYIVGRQVRNVGRYFLSPLPILRFEGLRRPLRIIGNGATLMAEPGLRFGVFEEVSLAPANSTGPNYRPEGIAAPYDAMIWISECLAPVEVDNVELHGNIDQMIIGGGYGDTGHQLPGSGLMLRNNLSSETVTRVHSHHHPLDGAILDGAEDRRGRGRLTGVIANNNGRQGVSLVGGRSYDFVECHFARTGRSKLFSAPGAGIDIEAESKRIRDVTFRECRFSDNSGPGLLADQGNSENIRCTGCTFVGTTSWSAWPNKPGITFVDSTFVGAVANPFASANPALATRFERCRFRDDPRLADGATVFFNNASGSGPIVDLGGNGGQNVLFSQCDFQLTHQGRLPWSWHAVYADNVMNQANPETGYPRGRYLGRNVINGRVDLYSSTLSGEVIVNGRRETR